MTNCNVLLILDTAAKSYLDTLIAPDAESMSSFPSEKVSTLLQNASLFHIDSKTKCVKYIWRGINWSEDVGGKLLFALKQNVSPKNMRIILIDNLNTIKDIDHGSYTSDVFMPAISMFEEWYEQRNHA